MKIKKVYVLNNNFVHVIFNEKTRRIVKTYKDKNGIIYFDVFCHCYKLSDFI